MIGKKLIRVCVFKPIFFKQEFKQFAKYEIETGRIKISKQLREEFAKRMERHLRGRSSERERALATEM